MSSARVEVLYFDGCPNVEPTLARVREAMAAAGIDATTSVSLTLVVDDAAAIRDRFLGSPTVRVDGRDVDPAASERRDYGLSCRVYLVDGRYDGAPPARWIVEALRGSPATEAPEPPRRDPRTCP